MPRNVVIIGQGEIGYAIKYLLNAAKHKVNVECWDVDIHACPGRKSLKEIIPKANVIFLCIPSWTIRAAGKSLKRYLKKKTIIVCLCKGLDRTTGQTIDVMIDKVFSDKQPTVLLSGPMLAEELVVGKPGAAVIASENKRSRQIITELFKGTRLHVDETSDVRGVALCGILKNIYAIGFSMAQALRPGDNYRGLYVHMTIEEMFRILPALGGKRDTVCSYAGIGDLIATGFSKHSKNHEYGKTLALTGEVFFDSEGSVSLKPMSKRIGALRKNLVLFSKIHSIVLNQKPPSIILDI